MCGNGMLNGSLALCQTAFAGTNCKVRECLVDRQLNQGAGSIAGDRSNFGHIIPRVNIGCPHCVATFADH